MDAFRLFLFTLQLLAPPSEDAVRHRVALVDAVQAATSDPLEQLVLLKVARFESSFRRDVGACRVRGPQGELGAWQILARSDAERARLCVSLEGDARVALERIRESRAACAHLPEPEQLATYARGSCSSREGRRLSRVRWPSAQEIP